MSAHMDDVTGKAGNLARILLILTALLVSCGGDDATATPNPAQQALTAEAAVSFAQLPPLNLGAAEGVRTFHIVPGQSKVFYIVDEELFADATRKYGLAVGKTQVIGSTWDVDGLLQLDLATNAIGTNRFAVYLPTLQTDQHLRDTWVRDNALESNRFPLAVFRATEIQGAPQSYQQGTAAHFQLVGTLTIRAIDLPVVWAVTASLRDNTITGSAETRLRMTDFGFEPPHFANTLSVQDEFGVRIEFVAEDNSG